MPDFPVFDLSRFERAGRGERAALGAEVDDICRSTGFLAISGHGVPQTVIDGAWSRARAFFDRPADEKQKARAPFPGYPYGYLGPESEALAKSKGQDTPPDLKGELQRRAARRSRRSGRPAGARLLLRAHHLAEAPEGFRPAWEAYYRPWKTSRPASCASSRWR
jgi:isopenicillin N synthase-like dioxygenase